MRTTVALLFFVILFLSYGVQWCNTKSVNEIDKRQSNNEFNSRQGKFLGLIGFLTGFQLSKGIGTKSNLLFVGKTKHSFLRIQIGADLGADWNLLSSSSFPDNNNNQFPLINEFPSNENNFILPASTHRDQITQKISDIEGPTISTFQDVTTQKDRVKRHRYLPRLDEDNDEITTNSQNDSSNELTTIQSDAVTEKIDLPSQPTSTIVPISKPQNLGEIPLMSLPSLFYPFNNLTYSNYGPSKTKDVDQISITTSHPEQATEQIQFRPSHPDQRQYHEKYFRPSFNPMINYPNIGYKLF